MADSNLTLSCAVNGTQYTTNLNNALDSIDRMHSGSSAPTHNLHDGKLWLDDSSGDNIIKIRIGSSWHNLFDFDGSKWYAEQAKVATKLETPRTIGGVSFDGSANINLPGVNAAGNQNTSGKATTAGTADSAAVLATARTIGGVSFDGSSNINLPGVNVAGNQNTSGKATTAGNADTATALASGRTVGMTGDVVWTSSSFTGAGNVTGTSTIQPSSVDNSMLSGSIANSKLAGGIANSKLAGGITGSKLDTDTAGNGVGKRTVSTSDASGSATNGDIWYKVD